VALDEIPVNAVCSIDGAGAINGSFTLPRKSSW
jgi:hypothetical protein